MLVNSLQDLEAIASELTDGIEADGWVPGSSGDDEPDSFPPIPEIYSQEIYLRMDIAGSLVLWDSGFGDLYLSEDGVAAIAESVNIELSNGQWVSLGRYMRDRMVNTGVTYSAFVSPDLWASCVQEG